MNSVKKMPMKTISILCLMILLMNFSLFGMKSNGDQRKLSHSEDNGLIELIISKFTLKPGPDQINKCNAMINAGNCDLYYPSNDVERIEVQNMGKVLHVYFTAGELLAINTHTFDGTYFLIKNGDEVMLAKKNNGKIVSTLLLKK